MSCKDTLKEAGVMVLIVLCIIDATGGKDKDNKTLSQKDKPNKPLAKHSLKEAKGGVNHMHFSSSEVILSASKYKRLYTQPEHCHPKRKQAIETSASKVAEWLSTNDTSSVNVQDTDNEEGTTDVHSESEEGKIGGLQ